MNRSAAMADTVLARPSAKLMPSSNGMLDGLSGVSAMTRKAMAVTPMPIAYQRRADRVVSINGAHSTFHVLGNTFMAIRAATCSTLTPC